MPGFRLHCALLLGLVSVLPVASISSSAQSTRGNSVPVPDPTLGVQQGNLPILPGWHGEAHIDRTSDPLSYALGTLTADLRSPDGTASIQMLAVPFHTLNVSQAFAAGMPGNPGRQRNAALVHFTSTADLLKRFILPALRLPGQPVTLVSMSEDTKVRLRSGAGVPGAVTDTAVAVFVIGKNEVIVMAQTMGAQAGTPRENTTTTILVCSAPQGKGQAILEAQEALPPVRPTPAWEQANERYLADWRQAVADDSARATETFRRGNEAILAQGHANVAAMQARGAERDRAFAEHEQRTSDLGANFRGYLSGSSVTYKWCGATGSTYTVDDTRAPAAGLHRCD